MTKKQAAQFNQMRDTLRKISKDYQSSEQLRKSSEKDYWLDYEETLEMAYENVKYDAERAVKGVKAINTTHL